MDIWPYLTYNPIDQERLQAMRMAAGAGPVLILTHDNPDPDGLASGKALATLFHSAWNIPSQLRYSGLIERAENKAMLRILSPEWEPLDAEVRWEDYSAVALVDTQPGAGNNRLPSEHPPQIVIDHHRPVRDNLQAAEYVDVRTDVGATVSMTWQYLEAAGVNLETDLATAIFYGVQADTQGLSRGGSLTDQVVYLKMLARLDRLKLTQVEQAGLQREYFRAFNRGLEAARVFGRVVVSYLGAIHRPDFVAEIADLLIRLEGTRAVLCIGYHGQTLYLSLRTVAGEQDAGLLIQQVIFPPGKAGGHGNIAGGQLPLTGLDVDQAAQGVEMRFLQAMGENAQGEYLL
jgi:nanoRNase/pAp phosphatase (c-di-AMP/oligoRNAs hydrolase)